jgi:hypothetical protein
LETLHLIYSVFSRFSRTQGLHSLLKSGVGPEQPSFLPGEEKSSVMKDLSQTPLECVPVSDLLIVFVRSGIHKFYSYLASDHGC